MLARCSVGTAWAVVHSLAVDCRWLLSVCWCTSRILCGQEAQGSKTVYAVLRWDSVKTIGTGVIGFDPKLMGDTVGFFFIVP